MIPTTKFVAPHRSSVVPSTAPASRGAIWFLAAALALPALGLVGGTGCAKKQPETVGPMPVGSLNREWKLDLDLEQRDDSIRGLYLRDNVLFAYSQRNTVVALNPDSGRVLFAADVTPDNVGLKPPIMLPNDRVAFPDGESIEVYDMRGKKLQSVVAERSIRSPGTHHGDLIFVGLDYPAGGRLAALDLTRRFDRERWELMAPGSGISSAPVVWNQTVYSASEDGKVRAVSLDRTPAWPLENSTFDVRERVLADLRADESGLYVAAMDTKLYVLDLSSGRVRWQYYAAAPLRDAPTLTEDTVFQPVPGLGVVALDKSAEGQFNREPRWIAKGATRFLSIGEKYVFMLGADNRIVAFDRQTGEARFKSKRNDLVAFAVNAKGPRIFAATAEGVVIAIDPVTKPGTVGTVVQAPTTPAPAPADAPAAGVIELFALGR